VLQILKDEMASDSAGMSFFISSKTRSYNCMHVLDEDSHVNMMTLGCLLSFSGI